MAAGDIPVGGRSASPRGRWGTRWSKEIKEQQMRKKEKEFREEYPAIKDAYDKYLELLALHGFYDD